MKKDYRKLMVIGSGPIVIGQAAEFDFSGSQACRTLNDEGYSTVLVNSNPATIQTDTDMADSVYIEPLDAKTVAAIIEHEGVDGVLSGMGGQTALNICSELYDNGTLERLNCDLVGTQPDAIAGGHGGRGRHRKMSGSRKTGIHPGRHRGRNSLRRRRIGIHMRKGIGLFQDPSGSD